MGTMTADNVTIDQFVFLNKKEETGSCKTVEQSIQSDKVRHYSIHEDFFAHYSATEHGPFLRPPSSGFMISRTSGRLHGGAFRGGVRTEKTHLRKQSCRPDELVLRIAAQVNGSFYSLFLRQKQETKHDNGGCG
jgi:hypothetical protein